MTMQRDKIILPPLDSVSSSRINSFQEYALWERQRKNAYRNELQQEIEQHTLSRENLERQKERDRIEVNVLASTERQRNQIERHLKIKTEQKYMNDNWNILEQNQHSAHKRLSPNPNPQPQYREHPFVKLIDQQDQRQQETKNNFIYQNKLNDMQSEMRRQQSVRRKHYERKERRAFEEHVEEEYRKKQMERELFENKYLKIDKNSNYNCKKEYLQYLKAQSMLNRSQHHRRQPQPANRDSMDEVNRASPGFIGLSPASFDRIKQLKTVQKSLKLFNGSELRNQSTLDYSNRRLFEFEQHSRKPISQKMMTERATSKVEHTTTEPFQALPSRSPSPVSHQIQPQLSERLDNLVQGPTPPSRTFRHFNIINCRNQIFVK